MRIILLILALMAMTFFSMSLIIENQGLRAREREITRMLKESIELTNRNLNTIETWERLYNSCTEEK